MIVLTDKHRIPFQIDEADYEAVSRYSWCIAGGGYPYTNVGKRATVRAMPLYVFLLGPAPEGLEWDHRDRDPLNNQRWNLRAVTRPVNVRNAGLPKNNTSGVKGVHWFKKYSKWCALITTAGRKKNLGYFETIEAAAAARRAAEIELWGEPALAQAG